MSAAITEPQAPAALDHTEIRSIVIGIMLAMFLGALDQTIVATALPTIGRALHDVDQLPWVVTAYLLSSTAVTPLYGKLSDLHGRRAMMLVSIGVFVVGSIACALAPSMLMLILARGLQGIGGGGLISLAQTIVGDIVAPMQRARYQAYFAAVFVTSSVAGPILGGVFAQHLHWSLIFWINLPLGLAALRMTDSTLRRLPRHERPHKLDLVGAALIVLATVAFLLALSWGGNRYPWGSTPVISLVATAAGLTVLFALRLATADEPFLPLSVLLNPVVAWGTATACFAMGTLIGLSIYVPVYFELVQHLTASQSGMALLPLMCGVIAGATLSGRLMVKLRRYKRPPMVGLTVATVGAVVLALNPNTLPLAVVVPVLALVGAGIGTVLPVTTVAIQNAVPMHQLGTATGTMSFFRSLGGAVAVAGFGAIVITSLAANGTPIGGQPAATAVLFRYLFLAAAAGFAASLACLLVMNDLPLRSSTPNSAPTAVDAQA
jgi:EmrB/QacA subfamily drug resistance transporter